MSVGQTPPMDGLGTVAAKELDRWIAGTLEPSTAFCRQVKQTVRKICDFLKEDCFEGNICVLKTVKGGSAGKGTALKNNSDADVVLFLSCFSSYQDQKQERSDIQDLIKRRLHACRQSLTFTVTISEPQCKGQRSVSLTLSSKQTSESIRVDILPAYDALGQVSWDTPPDMQVFEGMYVGLLNAKGGPGEFSPCFTKLQKKFVKRYPTKLKNLLLMVKNWYKENVKPRHPARVLPPQYALELLTIYAWEEGTGSRTSFNMAKGFRTVLELLCRHEEICIYWETYYSLQHNQIGAHVKDLLHKSHHPIILDPADPTGILGQGKKWDLVAVEAANARSLLCVKTVRPWKVQPARPVTIEVKPLEGKSLIRTVSPDTTVWQLKEEIEREWSIPWYRQRLQQQRPGWGSIVLQHGQTLATHGIFYSTTLMLLQTLPQEMEVFVKNDKNRTTTYTVLPTITVWQLKEQIHTQQGPPADQQYLTCGSTKLKDQHTLAHYNIQPRSTIFMVPWREGGAGPQESQSQSPGCSVY